MYSIITIQSSLCDQYHHLSMYEPMMEAEKLLQLVESTFRIRTLGCRAREAVRATACSLFNHLLEVEIRQYMSKRFKARNLGMKKASLYSSKHYKQKAFLQVIKTRPQVI